MFTDQRCPTGWRFRRTFSIKGETRYCYYFNNTRVDYQTAKSDCHTIVYSQLGPGYEGHLPESREDWHNDIIKTFV